jgi:hypothetical protein
MEAGLESRRNRNHCNAMPARLAIVDILSIVAFDHVYYGCVVLRTSNHVTPHSPHFPHRVARYPVAAVADG